MVSHVKAKKLLSVSLHKLHVLQTWYKMNLTQMSDDFLFWKLLKNYQKLYFYFVYN